MSNFEGKIYDVTKQAVKEVYGLDVGPDTLVVEFATRTMATTPLASP